MRISPEANPWYAFSSAQFDRYDRVAYHIEEGEVLLLLADIGEFLPLGLGGVDTGRVLIVRSTNMRQTSDSRVHKHVAR